MRLAEMITEETVRKQLDMLVDDGSKLVLAFAEKKAAQAKPETEPFDIAYQRWYSRALPLMKRLAPDRYAEFQSYYHPDPKRQSLQPHNFVIQDYLRRHEASSSRLDGRRETVRCFTTQVAILQSIGERLEWMALDTEDQAARGLQLAELEAARDLIKISERAAGALAGVVLVAYLRKLATRHQLKLRKQSPTLSELVDALKAARVLDVPVYSQTTWLAEIRDRCQKSEGEAPTKLQIRDLIDGTHWLLTNVF
jgi:hypothetical protein